MAHAVFKAIDLMPVASRAKEKAKTFGYGNQISKHIEELHSLIDMSCTLGNGEITLQERDAGSLMRYGGDADRGIAPQNTYVAPSPPRDL